MLFRSAQKQLRGGTVCCVPYCTNKKLQQSGLSWHVFPKHPVLRREWIKRIARAGRNNYEPYKPTNSTRICGQHFNSSGIKKQNVMLTMLKLKRTYSNEDNILGNLIPVNSYLLCRLIYFNLMQE
jgi:hypothetical protein